MVDNKGRGVMEGGNEEGVMRENHRLQEATVNTYTRETTRRVRRNPEHGKKI